MNQQNDADPAAAAPEAADQGLPPVAPPRPARLVRQKLRETGGVSRHALPADMGPRNPAACVGGIGPVPALATADCRPAHQRHLGADNRLSRGRHHLVGLLLVLGALVPGPGAGQLPGEAARTGARTKRLLGNRFADARARRGRRAATAATNRAGRSERAGSGRQHQDDRAARSFPAELDSSVPAARIPFVAIIPLYRSHERNLVAVPRLLLH